MSGIAALQDVNALEAGGLPADLPVSTYEMISREARINPNASALSFFLLTDEHREPEAWTYKELLAQITQTANFFSSIGLRKDDVIAFILLNLPETHVVIWGRQATGIVAALNSMSGRTQTWPRLTACTCNGPSSWGPFFELERASAAIPGLSLAHAIPLRHSNGHSPFSRSSSGNGYVSRSGGKSFFGPDAASFCNPESTPPSSPTRQDTSEAA